MLTRRHDDWSVDEFGAAATLKLLGKILDHGIIFRRRCYWGLRNLFRRVFLEPLPRDLLVDRLEGGRRRSLQRRGGRLNVENRR